MKRVRTYARIRSLHDCAVGWKTRPVHTQNDTPIVEAMKLDIYVEAIVEKNEDQSCPQSCCFGVPSLKPKTRTKRKWNSRRVMERRKRPSSCVTSVHSKGLETYVRISVEVVCGTEGHRGGRTTTSHDYVLKYAVPASISVC